MLWWRNQAVASLRPASLPRDGHPLAPTPTEYVLFVQEELMRYCSGVGVGVGVGMQSRVEAVRAKYRSTLGALARHHVSCATPGCSRLLAPEVLQRAGSTDAGRWQSVEGAAIGDDHGTTVHVTRLYYRLYKKQAWTIPAGDPRVLDVITLRRDQRYHLLPGWHGGVSRGSYRLH
jgi:hypothetical protein